MKEQFKKNLEEYSDAIKASFADMSKEGKAAAADKRRRLIETAADASQTTPETEATIYTIQKAKLEKLGKFKRLLERTRNAVTGGFVHPETETKAAVVSMDAASGFIVRTPDGGTQIVTLGEIMTDHEWDIEYSFDRSVDIHAIRKYHLEKLKHELGDKLNAQIIASESAYAHGDTFRQEAYKKVGERLGRPSEQHGVIAEKMVKNFLKKLAIDTGADFTIIDADAHQDVEQKIDFIIHRTSAGRVRGAKVEESASARDIGIQFTTAVGKSEQKERQIAKSKRRLEDIDDLVLVTLPVKDATTLFNTWKHKKTPGGPEKLWSKEAQEIIFRGVMAKLLSEEEIEVFCAKHFKK